MKFALKLVFGVMTIVCILFAASGIIFVKQNFSHSLSIATDQNADQHMLQKYALESNMLGFILSGESYTEEKLSEYASRLTSYGGGIQKYLGVFSNSKASIYSNLPDFSAGDIVEAAGQDEKSCLIKKANDKTYMLFTSLLDIKGASTTIISAYDISELFIERDRQNQSFLILNSVMIVVSGMLIGFMAWFLTRPIVRLNRASNKIADGSYSERTNMKSHDEIGELSQSFDKMVAAVEDNVETLKGLVQQRDDFIAAFSHEIKTPMTSIIGFADILRTEVVDSTRQLKYATIIYGDAKRLEALSLKLIDLMELSDEKIKLSKLSVEKLLTGIEKRMESLPDDFVLSVQFSPTAVWGDEILLDCLIGNLVSNAKKAEPKDNKITIVGEKREDKYLITVSDKGVGIPLHEITRITEPFYMIDKSRARTQGRSGLGLFLCQRIATLHKTSLCIESEPGVGTSISFELELFGEGEHNV